MIWIHMIPIYDCSYMITSIWLTNDCSYLICTYMIRHMTCHIWMSVYDCQYMIFIHMMIIYDSSYMTGMYMIVGIWWSDIWVRIWLCMYMITYIWLATYDSQWYDHINASYMGTHICVVKCTYMVWYMIIYMFSYMIPYMSMPHNHIRPTGVMIHSISPSGTVNTPH